MKRAALILPLLVLLGACATTGIAKNVPTPISPSVAALNASVWPLRDGYGEVYCTAFSINEAKGYWMTAKHCQPEGAGETVGQVPQAAMTVYADPQWDIAVLQSLAHTTGLQLGDEPEEGDIVSSAGYGYRGLLPNRVLRTGCLLFARAAVVGEVPSTVYGFPSVHGDSGSPIVDAAGALVGLVWGLGGPNETTWGVPYTEVARVYHIYGSK